MMDVDEMEVSDQIIVDAETLTLCRLCTENQGKYQIGPNLKNIIQVCFDISIMPFDGMSQIICNKCKIIVMEISKVRTAFKDKQNALIERRKKLLAEETCESQPQKDVVNNVTSTSVGETKPVVIDSDDATEVIEVAASPKPDSVASMESSHQVSSVTSSDRAVTPYRHSVTPPIIDKVILPSSNVSSANHEKVELLSMTSSKPPEKELISISPKSEQSKDFSRIWTRFSCICCCKIYPNRTMALKHTQSKHPELWDRVRAETKPCSIQMVNINLFKDNTAPHNPWVSIRDGKMVRFDESYPFLVSTKMPSPSNKSSPIDQETSDEEPISRKKYKRICTWNEKKIVDNNSDSDTCPRRNSSDSEFIPSSSESSKSFTLNITKPVVPEITKVHVGDPTNVPEHKSVPERTNVPEPINLALSQSEVTKIVESCFKKAKLKQSLTSPISQFWLMDEILNCDYVPVIWTNAKALKVSRIVNSESVSSKDCLSDLPLYADMERTLTPNGHERLFANSNLPVQAAKQQPQQQSSSQPKNNISNIPITVQERSSNKTSSTPVTKFGESSTGTDNTEKVNSNPSDSKIHFISIAPATSRQSFPNKLVKKDSKISKLKKVLISTHSASQKQPKDPLVINSNVSASNAQIPMSLIHNNDTTHMLELSSSDNVNPIIISAMSLADVEGKESLQWECKPEENEEAVEKKPLIKCKPVSMLMANVPSSDYLPTEPTHKNIVLNGYSLNTKVIKENMEIDQPYSSAGGHIISDNSEIFQHMGKRSSASETPLLSQNLDIQVRPFVNIATLQPSTDPNFTMEVVEAFNTQPIKNYIALKKALLDQGVTVLDSFIAGITKHELVRFMLTIKEKSVKDHSYLASDFLVEVGAYIDGTLLIILQDSHSNLIDVNQWSDDFQFELVKSLKKDSFLKTMKNVSSFSGSPISLSVKKFIKLVETF